MSKPNIILIGLMAVGKSTVGRLLAQTLHMEFYDSDHEIERRAGAPVSWIFDVEGEQGFRLREHHVLDELTARSGVVVATGGGAVLWPCNRSLLAARGIVIHLDSPIERLVERTRRDRKRPLLQNGNPRETLARLHREREPMYREIADYRFVTDQQGPRVLARDIEKRLREDGVI
ncbi:MAG TPA: shikimate kinase AroK [Pseudomonadales bacterium]